MRKNVAPIVATGLSIAALAGCGAEGDNSDKAPIKVDAKKQSAIKKAAVHLTKQLFTAEPALSKEAYDGPKSKYSPFVMSEVTRNFDGSGNTRVSISSISVTKPKYCQSNSVDAQATYKDGNPESVTDIVVMKHDQFKVRGKNKCGKIESDTTTGAGFTLEQGEWTVQNISRNDTPDAIKLPVEAYEDQTMHDLQDIFADGQDAMSALTDRR